MSQLDDAVQELGLIFEIPTIHPTEFILNMPKCANIPRYAAENFSLDLPIEKCAWISIQEPDCDGVSHPNTKNEHLDKLSTLKVKFWDITEPIEGFSEKKLNRVVTLFPPSKADAKEIVDFIKANQGKSILVNCAAGVSRSGAICKFLEECMGYTWVEWNKKLSQPNLHLFNLMREYYTGETHNEL